MTAKDKAFELVDNFDATLTYLESKTKIKQCAIFAVDEIIAELLAWGLPYGFEDEVSIDWAYKRMKYWDEVKEEIQKL